MLEPFDQKQAPSNLVFSYLADKQSCNAKESATSNYQETTSGNQQLNSRNPNQEGRDKLARASGKFEKRTPRGRQYSVPEMNQRRSETQTINLPMILPG